MTHIELINEIDTRLAESVDATRRAHAQIQQITEHFRRQARLEEAQNETNPQQPKNKGE